MGRQLYMRDYYLMQEADLLARAAGQDADFVAKNRSACIQLHTAG